MGKAKFALKSNLLDLMLKLINEFNLFENVINILEALPTINKIRTYTINFNFKVFFICFLFCFVVEDGDDDGLDNVADHPKDVLSSGSASPSSLHSLEAAPPLPVIIPSSVQQSLAASTSAAVLPIPPSILPLSSMIRDSEQHYHQQQLHQQQQRHHPHSPTTSFPPTINTISPIRMVRTPPHLIDSHDDVEHSIPASFIQDSTSIAER